MEKSFFQIFRELEDPRNEKGKKYPLIDIITLAIYGVLCGYTDFANMAYYLKKREEELKEKLSLMEGVPSHDVFSDVFRMLDVEKFMSLFVEWMKQIAYAKDGKHIAIDGKAVRAATEKAAKGNIPYVVSAFMCESGLSIGQKEVGDKTNEITEIPKLLDLIDITDCVITIDAIGTQTAIMDKIAEKGGHFCLQLKRNQPSTYDNVKLYFDEMENDKKKKLDIHEEIDKDHGRMEKRKYCVIDDKDDIRAMMPKDWKHVSCIGMAVLERMVGDQKSEEVHFHVMDNTFSAEEYASLARGHWSIENSLHWVLDIHFGEDRSTARKDNAISNLTLLRKIAFNFANMEPSLKGKTTKKKMIDFMTDVDLFKTLLYEVIPASKAE